MISAGPLLQGLRKCVPCKGIAAICTNISAAVFIQELTCRAFLVADAHKRRTISKSDIARALSKSDHFDFLIDIVPRDETERNKAARVAASIPAGTHARKVRLVFLFLHFST